jgi:REP element-mobilizing transposase RayT
MRLRRPKRLENFNYIGKIAYSVTISTSNRIRAFDDVGFARIAAEKLLRTAEKFGFALIAYSLMPDHVHLMPMGERDDSDFEAFIRSWNTQTGYAWRQRRGSTLWQGGYYDRVLRSDVDLYRAACYIVMNPVRAGLVSKVTDYEFSGSTRYALEDFVDERDR